jgi:DNA repair exonuclease SbcCD ATPase subunit
MTGCNEENLSDTRRHRLIADENIQLKKQLERCNTEIEKQKQMRDECAQENKELKNKLQENFDDLVGAVVDALTEENQRLLEKKGELEEQIKGLEQELEKVKKQSGP